MRPDVPSDVWCCVTCLRDTPIHRAHHCPRAHAPILATMVWCLWRVVLWRVRWDSVSGKHAPPCTEAGYIDAGLHLLPDIREFDALRRQLPDPALRPRPPPFPHRPRRSRHRLPRSWPTGRSPTAGGRPFIGPASPAAPAYVHAYARRQVQFPCFVAGYRQSKFFATSCFGIVWFGQGTYVMRTYALRTHP